MQIKVRFRFNKRTGEVEEFHVDQESTLPSVEHDREHDRVAAEIGRVLERDPRVDEITSNAAPVPQPIEAKPDEAIEKAKQKQQS
jgi:hypothetical protein